MELKELYQEIIIDHGTQPRNCCALKQASNTAEGFNPLCGDKVKIYLKIEDDHVKQASFTGSGCAISTACASLLTEALPGKHVNEAKVLSQEFQKALKDTSGSANEKLGKLAALLGVKSFPARVKCATLPCHTLEAALSNNDNTVSTEDQHD